MLYPVIMAGGAGTRFWPRSRHNTPKQLIRIVGRQTMIQHTAARLRTAFPDEALLVVTNVDQVASMRAQLPDLRADQFVPEPCGRDTAPCIGLAAFILRKRDPDALMALCPADHVIAPPEVFCQRLKETAVLAAERKALAAFGIRATHPSPLYGYIHRGNPLPGTAPDRLKAFELAEFTEKPDRPAAEAFIGTGEYYWNSGNFVWHVRDILAAIEAFMPELYAGLRRIEPMIDTPQMASAIAAEYPALDRVSIDYGVMEKAPNAIVVEADFSWDDVGAWTALARHYPPDEDGNVAIGDHAGIDTRGCIIASDDGHLVATLGVKDLVVVQTDDATLVCDRSRAAEVKALVALLKENGMDAWL